VRKITNNFIGLSTSYNNPAFDGTSKYISVLTTAKNQTLFWTRWSSLRSQT